MNEQAWVELMKKRILMGAIGHASKLDIKIALRLPYGHEILSYGETPVSKSIEFQTDLAIIESDGNENWKPRVIIEAKVDSVSTHDAITYSHKAINHKSVHPYLRYGIILGNRKESSLPGRLYRHGQNFDFMASFREYEPSEKEMLIFARVLQDEIEASREMEKIIYDSRKKNRDHYNVLHRKLILNRDN